MKAIRPRLLIWLSGVAALGGLVFGFATGFFEVDVDVASSPVGSVGDAIGLVTTRQDLHIKPDGSLWLHGRPTTLETLERDLAGAFARVGAPKDRAEQPVFVWADDGAPKQGIDSAYDRLVADGWTETKLSLRTRQTQ